MVVLTILKLKKCATFSFPTSVKEGCDQPKALLSNKQSMELLIKKKRENR